MGSKWEASGSGIVITVVRRKSYWRWTFRYKDGSGYKTDWHWTREGAVREVRELAKHMIKPKRVPRLKRVK